MFSHVQDMGIETMSNLVVYESRRSKERTARWDRSTVAQCHHTLKLDKWNVEKVSGWKFGISERKLRRKFEVSFCILPSVYVGGPFDSNSHLLHKYIRSNGTFWRCRIFLSYKIPRVLAILSLNEITQIFGKYLSTGVRMVPCHEQHAENFVTWLCIRHESK